MKIDINENYVYVDYYNYELNRKVPFIIWTKDSKNNKILNKRIDKACNKGIITKNKAARLKSNLSKKLNETK